MESRRFLDGKIQHGFRIEDWRCFVVSCGLGLGILYLSRGIHDFAVWGGLILPLYNSERCHGVA